MNSSRLNYALKNIAKKLFKKIGISIKPLNITNDEGMQLSNYLSFNNIKFVLDVGANKGQFAESIIMKNSNYRIISVEPIRSCHKELERKSKNFKNWIIYKKHVAISNTKTTKNFFITESNHSSSLLNPIDSSNLDQRISKAHKVKEKIQINTITIKDLIVDTGINPSEACLKLDIQGMEFKVIESVFLEKIKFKIILIEASLEPLYYGEKNFWDLKEILFKNGYKIDIIRDTLVSEKNFKTLQLNVCFSLIE